MVKVETKTWMELVDIVREDLQSTENEFLYPHNRDEADSESIEVYEVNKALEIMKKIALGELVITGVEKSQYGRQTPMEMTWERFERWINRQTQWAENDFLHPYNEELGEAVRVDVIEKINMFGRMRELVDGRLVIVDL